MTELFQNQVVESRTSTIPGIKGESDGVIVSKLTPTKQDDDHVAGLAPSMTQGQQQLEKTASPNEELTSVDKVVGAT